MVRKYVLPAIAVIIIIALWVMYRGQRRLYQKTLQANYSLVTQMNELREKDQQLNQGMQQIRRAQEDAPMLKGTFIDRKKYFRQNWKNYIHVSLNDYKTGLLGGVKDIKVTAVNDTEFPLDNVVAEVQYFRSNGKLFKTEKITLSNIQAKSAKSMAAPDSRRGMSLKIRLDRITSQEMNFCFSASKKTEPGNNDPYQCTPETP
jgi:K+ transporter